MAQLNDLLVMGQSTLLGPTKILNTLNVSSTSTFSGKIYLTNTLRIGNTSSMSLDGSWCEGIRINAPDGQWVTIALGATAETGTATNMWSLHRTNLHDFAIAKAESSGVTGMIIKNDGKVGFGTITPSYKLDVNGSLNATTIYRNDIEVVDLSSSQDLSNKTYNGYSLGDACEKDYTDSNSASAISSTGTNLVTERDVYYGLPYINNSHGYKSTTTIYAPTDAGTAGYILKANGGTSAPDWLQTLPVANGGTGCTTLTSGYALIGNDTSAVSLRAITNNTSTTAVTASDNLITANTLYYHTGNTNITTVGTIGSGTWQGSAVGVAYGGTGRSSQINNRLCWTSDGTIFAGNHYASAGRIAINSTTEPTTSFYVNGTSDFNGNITVTGTVTATSYNANSDRRLKENITDFTPRHSILDLPIYKFDFINGAKNQIGCLAQDLQQVCPEIVNEDENGYLSIQENKIIYLLIDEVKKLKQEINELKGGK